MSTRSILIAMTLVFGVSPAVLACDMCGCTFNSRRSSTQSSGGSMIITPTANTLGQGHGTVGFLFEYQRFNSIPAGDAHSLHHNGHEVHGKDHEEFYNVSLGYGLLHNFDLFLVTPIVSKTSIEVDSHATLGKKESATGFGDLRLVGKYRFWEEGVDAALLLGVKAPTGATGEKKDSGAKFGIEQQPGSGSWDLTSGLALSRSLGPHVTMAAACQYTTLELHHEWALRDHSREQDKIWDSGGTTILISPGLSAELTDSVSAFWAMPIPIYQNLGGQHEEIKFEIITGVSWHF